MVAPFGSVDKENRMDKNTTIGMVLIVLVLVLFSWLNKPSEEEMEAAKHRQDSIAQVEAQRAQAEMERQATEQTENKAILAEGGTVDEASETNLKNLYGDLYKAGVGEEKYTFLENNLLKVKVSNKGGRIVSVELKNYQRYDSTKLILFEEDRSEFNLSFFAQNRSIRTDQLYFTPSTSEESVSVSGPEVPKGSEGRTKFNTKNPGQSAELIMRLDAGKGRYIDYVYTIDYNSYQVGYSIRTEGMNQLINTNAGFIDFNFAFDVPRQENMSKYGEDRYTTMYYKFKGDEVDHLSLNKSDNDHLTTPVKWVGYKQLFFSTVFIADDAFEDVQITTERFEDNPNYLTHFNSVFGLPYNNTQSNQHYNMSFYFGPNHYQTLQDQGNEMQGLINLGWPVVKHVNKYLIIPVFNWLRKSVDNFGIIILILTILIRTLVFPFTYKTYVSQAKMKALKPEIDEINKKYGQDKAMEKQQATMALYKKVGVNPMGGCLPMLFQFPFLIAMFYFFPGSIELRQESFLWAHDLSTYDSILKLPFTVPFGYGDHVSLFTLMMTVTTIIQTRLTSQTQDNSAMPGMKYMMYFMPIFFMFILNSYSSGLSYYYFLANVLTIAQTYIIRSRIDEDKVRAQLQANKKKPVKKSGFQKRLEEMAKQQQQLKKK